MKIFILIFFSSKIKESKITRGHNLTLVKEQVDWMLGSIHFLIVYMLVVLIILFKNRTDKYLVKAGHTKNKVRVGLHLE